MIISCKRQYCGYIDNTNSHAEIERGETAAGSSREVKDLELYLYR